ncbi:UNVERIFIED_CONTAM: hypothetical protein ITH57_25560, partial [Salmonella enterica subsp. enterica serovar Weltevreden]
MLKQVFEKIEDQQNQTAQYEITTNATIKVLEERVKRVESAVGSLAKLIQVRKPGGLPSDTIINPQHL